jgi:putative PIN family toxin of toxin-antitoxin system
MTERLLVVLDTVVVMGGLMGSPEGASAQVLRAVETGVVRLAVSDAFLREVTRVLDYPEIAQTIQRPVRAFSAGLALGLMGEMYHPRALTWPSLTDPKDAWMLDLAFASKANCIVSLDRHVHSVGQKLDIKVLRPGELLGIIRQNQLY